MCCVNGIYSVWNVVKHRSHSALFCNSASQSFPAQSGQVKFVVKKVVVLLLIKDKLIIILIVKPDHLICSETLTDYYLNLIWNLSWIFLTFIQSSVLKCVCCSALLVQWPLSPYSHTFKVSQWFFARSESRLVMKYLELYCTTVI